MTSDRDSGSGVEVAEGELEGRSGLDGEAQRFGDVLRERKGYDSRARQRPAPSRPRSDSHDEPGSAPVASRVASHDHPVRQCDKAGRQHEEHSRLDSLEGPEPIRRLVGKQSAIRSDICRIRKQPGASR